MRASLDDENVHQQLHDLLGRLEYQCEWFASGYVAVNLEPARSHDELFAGLATMADAVEVERLV